MLRKIRIGIAILLDQSYKSLSEKLGSRVKNRRIKMYIETVNEVYSKRHPGLRSEI